jgi:hypothetical protein
MWDKIVKITYSVNILVHSWNPLWFVLFWVLKNLLFDKFYKKFTSLEYMDDLASEKVLSDTSEFIYCDNN